MGWRKSMGVKKSKPQEQKPQKPQKASEQIPFASIAPFAPIELKTKTEQAPPPDLSKILPGDGAEYNRLWYQAHALADYVDGDSTPYSERIKKLPELNKLNDRLTELENKSSRKKAKTESKPENTREYWDAMIRCPVGTKLNQEVEAKPDHNALGDPGTCPACGQSSWWRLNKPDAKWICRRCHPPVPGLDVVTNQKRGKL